MVRIWLFAKSSFSLTSFSWNFFIDSVFVTPNTDGIPKNSYGMPSGHSQNAIFFSTYVILNLIYSKYNYLTKVYGIILFTLAGVGIMYSRVYLKCHTVEQVIAGGLIGGILGALYFKNKDKIKKIIFG